MIWLTSILGILAISRLGAVSSMPGFVLGVTFLVFASYGGEAWNWSSDNSGAGLPSEILADTSMDSLSAQALLLASAATFFGSIVASLIWPTRWRALQVSMQRDADAVSRMLIVAVALLFVGWVVGQGPSLLDRETYLASDGILIVEKVTSLIGPLAAVSALVYIWAFDRVPFYRATITVSAVVWYVATLSVGSRISLIFPLAALALVVLFFRAKPGLVRLFASILMAYAALYLVFMSFEVTLASRSGDLGLLNYADLLNRAGWMSVGVDESWTAPVQRFLSSFAASYYIIGESVTMAPDATELIRKANPLPSDWVGIDAGEGEVLEPYWFVPLAMLGESFGAFGPVGHVALYFFFALMGGGIAGRLASTGQVLIALVVISVVLLAGFMSLQYPSRTFWRLGSIVLFIPMAWWAVGRISSLFRFSHHRAINK
ncbi:hypothetical protein [Kocuria rosea]|uniref:hypothetical protein n=1 Tax=Kocuria rosea TaxID=1275 RepID=UPI000F6B5629|nr:hypothetical protein [Kocuria rosea]VEI50356.1 Uncharacterised protein [Kocuria rosea]